MFMDVTQMPFIRCAFGSALKDNCSKTVYKKRSSNAIECELAKFCPHLHSCNLTACNKDALISPMVEFVWDVLESRWECIVWLWQWAPLCQLCQWLILWFSAGHLSFLCCGLLSCAYSCWPVSHEEMTIEFIGCCRWRVLQTTVHRQLQLGAKRSKTYPETCH